VLRTEPRTAAYAPEQIRAFGLLPAEYQAIVDRLGREPNLVELGILGAMWSEHCSYKHTRQLLRELPTSGQHVLQGPGENAGAVLLDQGLAVVLKMESHNHPSAVEPTEGAATGVGGIVRDVFTMGARPVALLDSLRFGDPTEARTRYLVDGVIDGVGAYGNCIGVPTVGGELTFHPSYTGNPLVNVMCVGIAPVDGLQRAGARGPGNVLLLVGADTGRDGIQGAAFASNDDPETSHRGVVQVGNPFLEKLLLEACLEAVQSGRVLAMQDLGAAGLTSSSIEMAARGGLGVEVDVDRVPRREAGLSAFEVMLSESQERMLLLVAPSDAPALARHFARWELHAEVVGRVTDDSMLRVLQAGQVVAELPIPLLVDEVPAYELHGERPPRTTARSDPPSNAGTEWTAELARLLRQPNLGSRAWAFGRYDSTVQANTVVGPGGGAAVLRVDGTTAGLAITTDCNPRYTSIDPRRGAEQAIAEAARNLACAGARPLAVTDCLNFGNPEKPTVAWQLSEAVAGLAEACRAFDVPIVSGNVSLYNETAGQAIAPTPAVGMVGKLMNVEQAVRVGFRPDEAVVLLGAPARTWSTGEYAGLVDADSGAFPAFDLAAELRLSAVLVTLAERGLLRSAQDISDGGLAIALVESSFPHTTGVTVNREAWTSLLSAAGNSIPTALFSEDQGRAVMSCRDTDLPSVLALAGANDVPALVLGRTGGRRLVIGPVVDGDVEALRQDWERALGDLMQARRED
jgi:phosphoribosylformylglycinamidine synthase